MTDSSAFSLDNSVVVHPGRPERSFYAGYTWCLDPYPEFAGLVGHLRFELQHLGSFQDWRRDENFRNIYLYLCGLYCAAADYASSPRLSVPAAVAHIVPAVLLRAAENGIYMPATVKSRCRYARVKEILRILAEWIDWACDPVLGFPARQVPSAPGAVVRQLLRHAPKNLLRSRMQIPEAFRCQDLTLTDAASMGRNLLCSGPVHKYTQVIGLRTAGAYFAPLLAAYLRRQTGTGVSWTSYRPKSLDPAPSLGSGTPQNSRVIVVDDHPNTGATLTMAVRFLRQRGISDDRITIVVPEHPARPGWKLPNDGGSVQTVALPSEDREKSRFLESEELRKCLAEYLSRLGWEEVVCFESPETIRINADFRKDYSAGFQVRLKRLLDVRGSFAGTPVRDRFLVKSTGTGWLGYHAFLIAERLCGSVPAVLGLRDGFLFEQWVHGTRPAGGSHMIPAVSAYVAARTLTLPLERDPSMEMVGSWSAWDELASVLCRVYGKGGDLLFRRSMRSHLHRAYATSTHSVVDGRMRLEEWVERDGQAFKTDFEHHNFGGGELDLADPAYDLAGAAVELNLDRDSRSELVREYQRMASDPTLPSRLPVYQLLHLIVARKSAAFWLLHRADAPVAQAFADRYAEAERRLMNFVAEHLTRSRERGPVNWSGDLLFLDIDGVLEWPVLPFPHATPASAAAIRLLAANGISIVLNTARSLQCVRDYCDIWGLPGGIAEYGSVFWDAVRKREVPLIDGAARNAIGRCREAIADVSGTFLHPGYTHSVRAFRFSRSGPGPVPQQTVQQLLSGGGLSARASRSDLWIGSATASKHEGARRVLELLPVRLSKTFAIGDSAADVGLLRFVDTAFAPRNASREVRALAREGKCRIVRGDLQRGFLRAAEIVTGKTAVLPPPRDFLDEVLSLADLPMLRRLLRGTFRGVTHE